MRSLLVAIFFLGWCAAASAAGLKLEPGIYNGYCSITNFAVFRPFQGPVTIVVETNRQIVAYLWIAPPEVEPEDTVEFSGIGRRTTRRQFRAPVREAIGVRPWATLAGTAVSTNSIAGRVRAHFRPLGPGGFTAERFTGGDTSNLIPEQRRILTEHGY